MHFVILSSSPTSSILELAQKRPSEALEGEGESLMESKFEVFFKKRLILFKHNRFAMLC